MHLPKQLPVPRLRRLPTLPLLRHDLRITHFTDLRTTAGEVEFVSEVSSALPVSRASTLREQRS